MVDLTVDMDCGFALSPLRLVEGQAGYGALGDGFGLVFLQCTQVAETMLALASTIVASRTRTGIILLHSALMKLHLE